MSLGYFDALMLALVVIVALQLDQRPVLALILALMSGLVHEVAACLCALVYAASALRPGVDNRARNLRLGAAAGVLTVGLLVSGFVPSDALLEEMRGKGIAHVHWVNICVELMRYDLSQSLTRIFATPSLGRIVLDCLVRFAFTAFLITGLGLYQLRRLEFPLWRGATYLALCATPFALGLVAFDFARVFSWSVMGALLVYLVTFPPVVQTNPPLNPLHIKIIWAVVGVHTLIWGLVPPEFTFFPPRPRWLPEVVFRALPDVPARVSHLIQQWGP
jgi:hypothetical protein